MTCQTHLGRALFVLGATAAASSGQPNDPDFHLQWALQNTGQLVHTREGTAGSDIDAVLAWAIHAGGSPMTVAIVGTGVDPHPEFADRVLEGYVTPLAGGDPRSTLDLHGQGTRLAGLIAAAANNGVGIAGLNPHVQMLPVRAVDGSSASEASVAEGIRWAADNGADIILVPLQFYDGTAALADSVAYAAAQGSLVVATAGDDGESTVAYPAAFPGCMAVSATNSDDEATDFSNTGPEVEIAAPSENIWSATPDGQYAFESRDDGGFAAAYVAGAASLVWSYAPQLDAGEVRQILLDAADDLGDPGSDPVFGHGRLNARRALEMTSPPPLRFERLDALPRSLPPNAQTTAVVRIADGTQKLAPGSAWLIYRLLPGGIGPPIPLAPVGTDLYEVTFPAVPCEASLEYYLSASTDTGFTVFEPAAAPIEVRTAAVALYETLFHDDFETDRGWSTITEGKKTQGAWTRVVPTGSELGAVQVQPAYDYSTDAKATCYVTGQYFGGNASASDVDGGPVRLLSPTIELSSADAVIRFAAWVYSSSGVPDALHVDISRDAGQTWFAGMTLPRNGRWAEYELRLAEIPEATGGELQVRFSIADDPNDSLTEAALDDFEVLGGRCARMGDLNRDGRVDLDDWGELADCLTGPISGAPGCETADLNGDGAGDLLDAGAFQRVFSPG